MLACRVHDERRPVQLAERGRPGRRSSSARAAGGHRAQHRQQRRTGKAPGRGRDVHPVDTRYRRPRSASTRTTRCSARCATRCSTPPSDPRGGGAGSPPRRHPPEARRPGCAPLEGADAILDLIPAVLMAAIVVVITIDGHRTCSTTRCAVPGDRRDELHRRRLRRRRRGAAEPQAHRDRRAPRAATTFALVTSVSQLVLTTVALLSWYAFQCLTHARLTAYSLTGVRARCSSSLLPACSDGRLRGGDTVPALQGSSPGA